MSSWQQAWQVIQRFFANQYRGVIVGFVIGAIFIKAVAP